MRDWRDEENDRRIEEMYASRHGSGTDDILEFFMWIGFAFVGLLVVTGFLDSTFGWGLTDWVWGLVYEWTDGSLGSPS